MKNPVRWTAVLAALAVLFAFGAPSLAAQTTGTVRGAVVSQNTQRPLAGAQVTVPGTRLGTLTNNAGQFLIVGVPAGTRAVRVQMLGFGTAEKPVEVAAGESATVNFQLSETAIALDELVVTGTAAAVRKKEIGNSISAVTAAEIESQPVRNTQDILQGRSAGVTVMQSSGQPGSGQTIKIRGVNSVSQDVEPLIYVDGIRISNSPSIAGGTQARVQTNPLQDIPAEDIERIEVIKGASATTLYGTEASGGVIQIFTKKGVAGAPIWTAEVGTGIARQGDITSSGGFDLYTNCGGVMEGLVATGKNIGQVQQFVDPTCPADGDWFQDGLQQSYSLSVRGGSENITYFVSGNYGDAEATLAPGRSRDGGFRLNLGFAPSEDLTLAFNSSYTKRNSRFVPDGNNASGFLLNVGRGHAGYFKGGKDDDCAGTPAGAICASNGYLFDYDVESASNHFISGLTATYSPVANFNNRVAVGWDYLDLENEILLPFGGLRVPQGALENSGNHYTKLSLDYAGSFQNDFGRSISSTFSWGGQIFRDNKRYSEIDSQSFAGPGLPDLESGALRSISGDTRVAETNAGVFLQEMVGIQDRLFLTAGLRVDGNSAFGENFGLQAYPKLSASWVVSDYDFWPGGWWETFKVRAAVGESGKAPGAFDRLRTFAPRSADEGVASFTPLNVGNPDVGPERTREFEGGFDASFFSGRLGLEATAYRAITSDALVPITLPPSEGFLVAQTTNVGELDNSGLEFVLNLGLVQTETFDWDVRSTMSFMSSEVVDLNGQEIFADNKAEFREGFPAPAYFGRKITNPDAIADPIVENDQFIGDVFPTQMVGLGSTLRLFQDLQLDVLFEHQGGHVLPNYTGYQNARRGAWPACFDVQRKMVAFEKGDAGALSDVTARERGRCALNGTRFIKHHSDYWVDDADFVKLRSASLTYGIPDRFSAFAQNASVTLAATNLFTWTDYSGTDPESEDFADRADGNEGVFTGAGAFGRRDYYTIPTPRTYMLTFRFSF